MPIYNGSTPATGAILGTETTKVYVGDDLVYAKLNVTMNEQGGSNVSNKLVEYLKTYGSMPTTTKTAWAFEGWFTAASGGSEVTSGTQVTETDDHTLYAQWSENVYLPDYYSQQAPNYYSITFYVDNYNGFNCVLYADAGVSNPTTSRGTVLAGDSSDLITISGLSASTQYTVYMKFIANGAESSVESFTITTPSANPTAWSKIGESTSSSAYSYTDTGVYQQGETSCPATGTVDSWVTGAYPPANYDLGDVIRITVYYYRSFPTPGYVICKYIWYEAT